MIRVGSISADVLRIQSTVRGLRERFLGSLHAVIVPDPNERIGTTNSAVLGYLIRANPALAEGLDAVARAGARAVWRGIDTTLEDLTVAAGKAVATEWAVRLRSGRYVTNTDATRARKIRATGRAVGCIDTEQLASSLDDAKVGWE